MTKAYVNALDPIRFVAALAVVLYHYTYFHLHTSLAPVSRYGFLGVPLFFIISGFVITMSLNGAASPIRFLINRATRLYPAFVLCSVLTVAYVAAFTPGPYFSAFDFFANMTMFGEMLHAHLINAAYWSLAVEWVFYFLVFGVFVVLGKHRLSWFLWFWIVASGLEIFHGLGLAGRLLTLHNAPFFVAGAAMYISSSGERRKEMWVLLLVSLPIAIYWVRGIAQYSGSLDLSAMLVIGMAILFFYLLVAVVAHLPRHEKSSKILSLMGRVSYPLYLLHETIGWHILKQYYTPGIAGTCLIVFLIGTMIVAATLIAELWEKPLIDVFKRMSRPTTSSSQAR